MMAKPPARLIFLRDRPDRHAQRYLPETFPRNRGHSALAPMNWLTIDDDSDEGEQEHCRQAFLGLPRYPTPFQSVSLREGARHGGAIHAAAPHRGHVGHKYEAKSFLLQNGT